MPGDPLRVCALRKACFSGAESMRAMILRSVMLTAALALILTGTAAHAQFEVEYPDEPPEEGQTLLEWSNPPVLRHTIAESQRGDLSACDAQSEFDLDTAAYTCWPLLRALQLFTLADFAAGEPTGDKQANLRQGIGYADDALAFIGKPQWPLQEYLRTRALRLKVDSLVKLEEWDAALPASKALIANIESDLFRFDNFSLGFARSKHSAILLHLDNVKEARANLEQARALLFEFDGEKIGWPLSSHSRAVIVDAIRRGDFSYAERMADRYLEHFRTAPKGMQFGLTDHLDLKLYLVAARRDRAEALALIEEREAASSNSDRCEEGLFRFPLMLAPLRDDAGVIDALKQTGCKTALSERLQAVVKYGIRGSDGKELLPYPDKAR